MRVEINILVDSSTAWHMDTEYGLQKMVVHTKECGNQTNFTGKEDKTGRMEEFLKANIIQVLKREKEGRNGLMAATMKDILTIIL